MSTTVNPGTATQYRCLAGISVHCTRGDGKPRGSKCRHCGSALFVQHGVFGVFVHDGSGRYPLASAVRTFTRRSTAEKACSEDDRYVVRFVSA